MIYRQDEPANMHKSRRELMNEGAATLLCLSSIPFINSNNQSEQDVVWGEYLHNHTNNAVTSVQPSGEPVGTRWRIGNSEYPPYPIVRNQIIYVNRGDKISAIDKATGESIWDYLAESLVLAPAIDSMSIYFTTTDGDIVSLDKNGNHNWNENVGSHLGPPTLYNDRVYFAGGSQLYSFKKDGSGFQSVDIGELEQKEIVCIGDGHAYIRRDPSISSSYDQINKINTEDYSINTFQVNDVVGIPIYFNNTIITTGKYETAAVSAGSLNELWVQDFSEPIPPVAFNNKVIVPLPDAVFAYDIQTGKQLWEYPYDRDSGYPTSTIAGDRLLVSYGGLIQSIDANQGFGNWEYEFSSETSRSTNQIVPLSDGYLVTYGNELYMLETKRTVQTPTDTSSTDGGRTSSETSTTRGEENGEFPDRINPIRWLFGLVGWIFGLEPLSQIAGIVTAILTAILLRYEKKDSD